MFRQRVIIQLHITSCYHTSRLELGSGVVEREKKYANRNNILTNTNERCVSKTIAKEKKGKHSSFVTKEAYELEETFYL